MRTRLNQIGKHLNSPLAGACGSRELVLGNLDPIADRKFRVLSTEFHARAVTLKALANSSPGLRSGNPGKTRPNVFQDATLKGLRRV
jgi:hypothetical protein